MKTTVIRGLVGLAAAGVVVSGAALPALGVAANTRGSEARAASEARRLEIQEAKAARQAAREEARTVRQAKLADQKLELCQRREAKINELTTNLADRAERHLGVFDKIADRVKQFATDKNRKPANYDELVADVDTARAEAVAIIGRLGEQQEIDCEGDGPKAAAAVFKASIKETRIALKSYRSAVKELILGVKKTKPAESGDDTGTGGDDTSTGGDDTNTGGDDTSTGGDTGSDTNQEGEQQ